MSRIIFHVDINAFFATVEENYNPKFKTQPIGICGNNKKAILSTCNYLARQYGVKAAMPADLAKQLCPKIIFVKPRIKLYEKISHEFLNLIKTYFTSHLESTSIDECYIDVTDILINYHNNPKILAIQIQNTCLEKLCLPVSIGISDSKFLAKVASDHKKPLGIYELFKADIPTKLLPLPIESFLGIGAKKIPILHQMGIYTINDFKHYINTRELIKLFHYQYEKIMNIINGKNNDDQIISSTHLKNISKSNTLIKPELDWDRIDTELAKVANYVGNELNHNHCVGYCLTIGIKTQNKQHISKSKTWKEPITSKNIFATSKNLLLDLWNGESEIKFLSISISKLQAI